jgi:hypothetical protein
MLSNSSEVFMDSFIGYHKTYKMRRLGAHKKYISVAMPYEVVQRQAELHNLTVSEFINKFVAVAEYGIDDVRYSFREAETKDSEAK